MLVRFKTAPSGTMAPLVRLPPYSCDIQCDHQCTVDMSSTVAVRIIISQRSHVILQINSEKSYLLKASLDVKGVRVRRCFTLLLLMFSLDSPISFATHSVLTPRSDATSFLRARYSSIDAAPVTLRDPPVAATGSPQARAISRTCFESA